MRTRYWFLLVFLLAGFLTIGYLVLRDRFEAGYGMPAYSLYSKGENGYDHAARFAEKLGWQAIGLTRPIQNTRHQGLLIMVAPQHPDMFQGGMVPGVTEEDAKGVLRWVSEGNTLVLIGRKQTNIHNQLKIKLTAEVDGARSKVVRTETAREIGGYTEPLEGFGTFPVHNIAVETNDDLDGQTGLPLFGTNNKVGAWLLNHGDGRVIVIADPSIWTHRGLTREDNVVLLYNVLRMDTIAGRVYFDEYHHGIQSSGGYWEYLRYHDLHWLAIQLALLVALGMWAAAVRLGPALPRPAPPSEDTVDFASGVARIYQRAGVVQRMANHISRDFSDRITRILRLKRNASTEEILRTWKARHDEASTRELSELIHKTEELRDGLGANRELSRQELLYWVKRFDRFLSKQ